AATKAILRRKEKMPDGEVKSPSGILVDVVQQRLNCALPSYLFDALVSFDSKVLTACLNSEEFIVSRRPVLMRDLRISISRFSNLGAKALLLRKEVIQPQVPLRLPCYDFIPVTTHSVGGCLPCRLARRLRLQVTSMM